MLYLIMNYFHTHLINSRLLYKSGGIRGKKAMGCHDKDLVGSSLFQCLCCCHKAVNIIDNIILQNKKRLSKLNLLKAAHPTVRFRL